MSALPARQSRAHAKVIFGNWEAFIGEARVLQRSGKTVTICEPQASQMLASPQRFPGFPILEGLAK